MREIYDIELSTSAISIITNKVNQAAMEWQNRPLDPLYLIVWMDGIVFKVRDNGKIINKTVYLCIGLKQNGLKEVLGMWVGKTESSSFWLGVLTDLKARGVQDILIPVPTISMDLRTPYAVYSLNHPPKSALSIKSETPVSMWFIRTKRSLRQT